MSYEKNIKSGKLLPSSVSLRELSPLAQIKSEICDIFIKEWKRTEGDNKGRKKLWASELEIEPLEIEFIVKRQVNYLSLERLEIIANRVKRTRFFNNKDLTKIDFKEENLLLLKKKEKILEDILSFKESETIEIFFGDHERFRKNVKGGTLDLFQIDDLVMCLYALSKKHKKEISFSSY